MFLGEFWGWGGRGVDDWFIRGLEGLGIKDRCGLSSFELRENVLWLVVS